MSEAEGPDVFFDRDIRARPSINCGSFHHVSTERVGVEAQIYLIVRTWRARG
jgi:hypothetical protein